MWMRMVVALIAVGLLVSVSGIEAGEESEFPLVGVEYHLAAAKDVLPPEACGDGHIVVVERGKGPWVRVAYNYPSEFSWKPPEVGFVWMNLDHVPWMQEVAVDCCVVRLPHQH